MTWTAPDNTALIIVDVQNGFCPGGHLPVPEGDRIVAPINETKKHFGLCVVTQDWHPADHQSFASNHAGAAPFSAIEMPYGSQTLWPDHCVQGSEDAAIHGGLDIAASDLILQKGTHPAIDSYSGFFENDGMTQPRFANGKTLSETLRDNGIKRIVLCGLAYDFCVGGHALDGKREGFDVVVVKDITRSIAMPLPGGGDTEKDMDGRLIAAGVVLADMRDLSAILAARKPSDMRPVPTPL